MASEKQLQPIRCLQSMLRAIQLHQDKECSLIPDGIYGQQTLHAVMAFQQKKGMEVTGITDEKTWENIVAEYEHTRISFYHPAALDILMEPGQQYSVGDECCNILIAQAILNAFSLRYRNIPQPNITGAMDEQTQEAISAFQRCCCLPQTGCLDKETWMHMALQYPLCSEKYDKKVTENP